MTVKEWLSRSWKINGEIQELLEAKQRAKDLACKVTTTTDGVKVQTSRGNAPEDRFISYADYTALLCEKIDRQLEIQKEIVQVISTVEDSTYRRLLTARYINFKKWEQIADEMGYCWQNIHKIHNKALKAIVCDTLPMV